MTNVKTHALVALALAFGLSVFFWIAFGTFNLPGFILASLAAALIGGLAGWFLKRNIWITAIVTVIVRLVIYYGMVG